MRYYRYWVLVVVALLIVVSGITVNSYINRDRDYIPTPKEVFVKECSAAGGDPKTRVGWEDRIHIQEFECKGVEDVHSH